MGRRRQGRYRGSRKGIGVLIPVLIVLCVAAAVALFLINDNMTFTTDGAFFGKKKEETHEVAPNLIIEDGKVNPSENTEAENPPPEEENREATPENADTRAYFIGIDKTISENPLAGVPEGVNTVVFEVKSEDGRLAFDSDSALASYERIVAGSDEKLRSAVSKAREKGYGVSLYMSCFKDNEAARKNQVYSCRTANKIIWLDGENVRWLSAYSEKAREYLADLVKKLSEFGADEIILANISFPYYGKCDLLYYDSSLGTKSEQLKKFIDDALASAGSVPVSAVYENLRGNYLTESGQNSEIFKSFGKIYVSDTAGKRTREYSDAAEAFGDKICPISAGAKTSGSFLIKE